MTEPASTAVAPSTGPAGGRRIRTPDQRLRVFVSSTIRELGDERRAASQAIESLRLHPVLFELGARPHPPRDLYRAYLDQSDIFIGIYWESYGWVAPEMQVSGIEDEYLLSGDRPKLIYIKDPAPGRDERLAEMLDRIRNDDRVSYRSFSTSSELRDLISNDLALMLTERFEAGRAPAGAGRPVASELPALVNEFVGREKEVAQLERMLLDEAAQLISITGPGGIGKSRLALEAGRRVRDHFPDGAYLVLLEPINEADLIVPTIMHSVGIQEAGGVSPQDALAHYLKDRSVLLVLDNFEHVLAGATALGRVVEACPNLKVVVTTRVRLNLRGERELVLEPLELPAEDDREVGRLSQVASVQLFVERARTARSDFKLDESNAEAVAEVCRRLDGLPLALELAAARSRILTPQAMVTRLDSRLRLLTSGNRDLPQRHQTLRSAIEWSYDLLGERDKALFARCGIFRGGFTLEAVEAVCDPRGELDVLDSMQSLVENSLVRRLATEGQPRLALFDTVREFASELLKREEECAEVERRHADYYLGLVAESEEAIRTVRQAEWLDALEADNGNIRDSLRWSLDQGRYAEVAYAGWDLWLFWWVRDHLAEGRRWMEEVLLHSHELPEDARAEAQGCAGVMGFWQADYGFAVPMMIEALEGFRKVGNASGVALCQLGLGLMECGLGDTGSGLARLAESREGFRVAGDLWALSISYAGAGWIATGLDLDVYDDDFYEESIRIAREVGTAQDIALALGNKGRRLLQKGEAAEAEAFLAESTDILASINVRGPALAQIESLGEAASRRGVFTRAVRLISGAAGIRNRIGIPLDPVYGPRLEAIAAQLRGAIGDEDFEREWASGIRMRWDDLVRYALAPSH